MNRPWFQLYGRDWLDNKELRRCSPLSRAVLVDLMCLANEGVPYGHLADKVGPLTAEYMASRCVVSVKHFRTAVAELKAHGRIHETETGILYIERMVEDEAIRLKRATGGNRSIGHPHTHPPKQKEGYPSDHPSILKKDTLPSDSVCVSEEVDFNKIPTEALELKFPPAQIVQLEKPSATGFEAFWARWGELTNRKVHKVDALRAWIGTVPPDRGALAMACLERYGTSSDVARGAISNPENWLYAQARDNWNAEWPQPRIEKRENERQHRNDVLGMAKVLRQVRES